MGDNKNQEELHTALMEASMDGHLEVAKLLLDNGAAVNLASDSFESPLTLAACGGHCALVCFYILLFACSVEYWKLVTIFSLQLLSYA